MKGADAALNNVTTGSGRATPRAGNRLAWKFGVRSLLCDFHLRFYECVPAGRRNSGSGQFVQRVGNEAIFGLRTPYRFPSG